MTRSLLVSVFAGMLGVLFLVAAPALASPSCSHIATLGIPDTVIEQIAAVGAGPFNVPGPPPPPGAPKREPVMLPAFCRVQGHIKPAIKFEVWLPYDTWNGNFEEVGNGGFAGTIQYGPMIAALKAGYATASTDTGHVGGGTEWAPGHPELVMDYGYRAIHELTMKAKTMIEDYEGAAPRLSYFNGCSNGGRQGLMEAQRYPNDYDGILVGAPANPWTAFELGDMLWHTLATMKDAESFIPTEKLAAIDDATAAACDELDGTKDGLISDPRKCKFDPSTLVCKGADSPTCLTAKQADALKMIYAGVPPVNGKPVFPATMPGGERGWGNFMTAGGPMKTTSFNLANNFFKNLVYEDPNWDFHSWDYTKGVADTQKKLSSVLDATDYNLKPFAMHGGKMLMYHGWSDPVVSPLNTVNQYKLMVTALTGAKPGTFDQETAAFTAANEKAQDTIRLFMAPGMSHCGGGDGPSVFDAFTPLTMWVEKKQAPQQIIASHMTNNKPDRTRPLCPYPTTAQYSGQGSIDDASNFACKAPVSR
jgi:feruloyl esterase